jgi:non-heme chloroperoxidase
MGSKPVVVEGGPHGIGWTHTEIVNHELIEFLGRGNLPRM